jgi:outer membrane autotransporter protein
LDRGQLRLLAIRYGGCERAFRDRNIRDRLSAAGPYAGVRLSNNLYLDGRALWGRSSNEISPFLTYSDEFDTTRLMLAARLTGRWTHGAWTFSPSAELIKFQETSRSYTDSLGMAIGSQRVDIGRLIFGPEVSYTFRRQDGLSIVPRVTLRGIWDFERPTLMGLDATGLGAGGDHDTLRARVETGVAITDALGRRLDVSGAYDGLGSDDVKAVNGRARLTLPF